ncbi:MAG: DUF305 domain-containing protein [Renibacterium sp.]|nr:DUF305 domain-containing protein [Renibacterium sp.]
MKKTINHALAASALILLLAGCAGNPTGSSMSGMDHGAMPTGSATASSNHNAADTMFAQMMIVHHRQAVSMSDTVLAAPGIDSRVTGLAQRIKAAQDPEIEKMKTMLGTWGEPETMSGSMSMPGMLDESQLAELAGANGVEAAKLFLSQMIAHHQGAVESAKTELRTGSNPEAVQLAKDIIGAQQGEIDEMRLLLAGL